MQIPSRPDPNRPTTRRFDRLPSASMSNAVSRPANDSEMMSVELSGVTTMPLGNSMPPATWRSRRRA